MAGQGRRNRPSRSVLGAVRLASCGPLLLVRSTQLAGRSRSRLCEAEISLRSRGVVTKTCAPFPNHSHIGLPLPAGAGRHGQADKTFIRVCVCARRMTRARRPHLAHAQKQARGESSVELTRGSGTRSAQAAPPSIQGVRAVAPPHLATCGPPGVPASWAGHLPDLTHERELIGPSGNEPRAGAAAPGGG